MTILIAFLVFVLAVLLMSLGVIVSGRRIQGSCGGLANIPGVESDCGGACGGRPGEPGAACHHKEGSDAQPARHRGNHQRSNPTSISPGARGT